MLMLCSHIHMLMFVNFLLLVTGAEQHCYLCVLPRKIKGGERGGGGVREGGTTQLACVGLG